MGGKSKQTTTQTYTPPKWVESAAQQAIGLGRRIGSQQYDPFTGERVAPLSRNEQMGIDMARQTAGAFAPYAEQGRALLERASGSFTDPGVAGRYMNPYIESALDPAARRISERGALERGRLQSMAQSMGAFGGSRATLLERGILEDTQQQIGDLYKTGLAEAYDRAAQLFGQERARDLQASGQLMTLGEAVQRANMADINALMTTGATDRSIQQALRDFDYQQFLEGRDWDLRNLGGLLSALQGTQGSYSTTQTTTQEKQGSALGQALGIATTLLGAFYNPAGTAASLASGALGGGGGDGFSSFQSATDWLKGGNLLAPTN